MTEGKKLTEEAKAGDLVEIVLKFQDNYWIGRNGEISLVVQKHNDIPKDILHNWRGPIKSLAGYYGGYELKEWRGSDSVYLDSRTMWHEDSMHVGHDCHGEFIEIPLTAISSYEILKRIEEK